MPLSLREKRRTIYRVLDYYIDVYEYANLIAMPRC